MANDVEHIRRVATIEHGEARVEPEVAGEAAEQSIGNRVKGPGPWQAAGRQHRRTRRRRPDDVFDAPRHFLGGATRECQQENALRIDTFDDQVRDAVGEGHRLAGAGSGDDQQRAGEEATVVFDALAEFSGETLRRVQHTQVIEFLLGGLHMTPRNQPVFLSSTG